MPTGKTEWNILFTAVSSSISANSIGIRCRAKRRVMAFKQPFNA